MKTGISYLERPNASKAAIKKNGLLKVLQVIKTTGTRVAKAFIQREIYLHTICALFILLFIYTGLNKILDYETFKFQLGRSPFLQSLDGFISITLPYSELLIALAIVIKRTRLLGLYLSFFLMFLFTGYVWIMLNKSYYLPCSCGGILSEMSWDDHLVFNSVFTGLGTIGVLLQVQSNLPHDKR